MWHVSKDEHVVGVALWPVPRLAYYPSVTTDVSQHNVKSSNRKIFHIPEFNPFLFSLANIHRFLPIVHGHFSHSSVKVWIIQHSNYLVYFHNTVDFWHEPEAGEESYRACQQEEQEHHDKCVAKVEEGADKAGDLQFTHEVVYAVNKEIHSSKTTC